MSKPYWKPAAMLGAITLAFASLSGTAAAVEPGWVGKSNDNAKLLLNLMAKYSPESASSLGVDGYDEQITDMSRDLYDATVSDTRAVVQELQKRLKAETNPKIKQDLEILIGAANDQMASTALQRNLMMPFQDVSGLLFGVVQQTIDPRIPKERQKTLLVRLQKYAGLAKGYRPITELAQERLQERLKANPALLGPYKAEVEQVINDAPTMIRVSRMCWPRAGWKGGSRLCCIGKAIDRLYRQCAQASAAACTARPPPAASGLCGQSAPVRR